jgi:hypothetical protein
VESITITTNAPATPRLILTLKGEGRSAVKATPSFVNFGDVTEESAPPEQHVLLKVETKRPVKIALPERRPNRRLKYSLKTVTPGREYDLAIRLSKPYRVGAFYQYIPLTTDDPRQPTVQVRVRGRVVQRIMLEPANVRMRHLPPGEPFHATVRLVNNGKRPIKVISAKAGASQVKTNVREIKPGYVFQLQVEAPGSFTPPPRGTTVDVKTDDPKFSDLTFTLLPIFRPPPSPWQLVNKKAPSFSIHTLDQKVISNATTQQKVTLLDFSAINSSGSMRQVKELMAVSKSFPSSAVQVVLVANTLGVTYTTDQLEAVLKQSGVSKTNAAVSVDKTGALAKAFNVRTYPTLILLDKEGRVASVLAGERADFATRVKNDVSAFIAGRPGQNSRVPAERMLRVRPTQTKKR